jgi:hypothetical protein
MLLVFPSCHYFYASSSYCLTQFDP